MTLTPEAYPSSNDELLPSTTTVSVYIKANRLAYLSQKVSTQDKQSSLVITKM